MTHVLPAIYKKMRRLQDIVPPMCAIVQDVGEIRRNTAGNSGDSVRGPMNRLQGCIRF